MRPVAVVTESFPDPPGFDTAVSHAVLLAVARGQRPETFRLHPAVPQVAFGRQDVVSSGFPAAVEAATEQGFAPVQRLAGGRAAVFHEGTLAFSWAIPTDDPREGIHERFAVLASLMAEAFRDLGADARVGEVPGEYCPGRHSVNLGGRRKVMGVGQRLVRGAAHVGGVVVVSGSDRIRSVLTPVYRELDLVWDPGTVGALDEALPGIRAETVAAAVLARLGSRFVLVESRLDPGILREAASLVGGHLSPAA